MTKFFEWLYGLLCMFGVWYVLVTNTYSHEFVDSYKTLILWSPLLLITLFGVSPIVGPVGYFTSYIFYAGVFDFRHSVQDFNVQ